MHCRSKVTANILQLTWSKKEYVKVEVLVLKASKLGPSNYIADTKSETTFQITNGDKKSWNSFTMLLIQHHTFKINYSVFS